MYIFGDAQGNISSHLLFCRAKSTLDEIAGCSGLLFSLFGFSLFGKQFSCIVLAQRATQNPTAV